MAEREKRTQELLKSADAGAAARKRAARSSWAAAGSRVLAHHAGHDRVRAYAEAFQRVQDATGIADIDRLVAAFAGGEDANLTLFGYVTALSDEVDRLEGAVAAAKREIDAAEGEAAARDSAATSASGAAASHLERLEARAAAAEERLRAAGAAVEALQAPVARLFAVAGCDTPAVREALGPDPGAADAALLPHLGVVEQRANELLRAFAAGRGGERAAALHEALRAQPPAPPATRIVVEPRSTLDAPAAPPGAAAPPPTTDGADSGGEADDVPLSREALQVRLRGGGRWGVSCWAHGLGALYCEEGLRFSCTCLPFLYPSNATTTNPHTFLSMQLLAAAAAAAAAASFFPPQARVLRSLGSLLERSLKVKAAAAPGQHSSSGGGTGGRGSARRQ